jgi:hypothetical protein
MLAGKDKSKNKAAAQVYACPDDSTAPAEPTDNNNSTQEVPIHKQEENHTPAPAVPVTPGAASTNADVTPTEAASNTLPMISTETTNLSTDNETKTAPEAPADPPAAPAKPSLREQVAALGAQGLEMLTKPFEVFNIKIQKTKNRIEKKIKIFKPVPATAAAAGGGGGEAGVGQGAAAAVVAAAAALVLIEPMSGVRGAAAVNTKPTRDFLASKAHWAAKRLREAGQKMEEGVSRAQKGAKEQLQALKQRCSRSSNKS